MTALHLAVPDARPTPEPRLGQPLLAALADRAGLRLDHGASTVIAGGHAGFGVALERALASSRNSGTPAIAGAVDTYHCPEALRFLAREHRIHGSGVGNGFIPSEGAAFALVSAESGGPRLATVAALALGADACTESDDEQTDVDPPIAVAMTEVVGRALRAVSGDVRWVLVDLNGERHRSKEWTFVSLRLRHLLEPANVLVERPYAETGDLGAATGGLFAATACMAWQLGFAPSQRALLALHADGPQRAAIVLEAP
jgi:3-oxoacyl-[acyl-carrier-protein] synthase-1